MCSTNTSGFRLMGFVSVLSVGALGMTELHDERLYLHAEIGGLMAESDFRK